MKNMDVLKLQAYLDGELDSVETARIGATIAQEAGAQALVDELRQTRELLVANEPQAALPESLDFHWSKIAREIDRLEAAPTPVGWWGRVLVWLRYLAPASALAAGVVLFMLQASPPESGNEVYTESAPELSPVVFQSQEESMTVIWLQGDVNSEFSSPEGDL